jgi:hypothetical protein
LNARSPIVHSRAGAAPGRATRPRGRWRRAGTAFVACVALAASLAGCGGVHVKPEDHVPPPLVDELPLRAGVYYSPEFKTYVHREERWNTKWEVQLGGAHVTKLDRLLHAMFPKLTDVTDLAKPPQPPLDLILEPRFEEYSFVTPRDAGAEYYAVTIKYRMNLYDGQARLIDSLVYTGYGNTGGSGLTSEKPLVIATERAMRDAGAKFATEFGDQATVRKLVAGEPVEPVSGSAPSAPGVVDEVSPPPGRVPPPAAPAAATPAAAAPAAAAPEAPGAATAPGAPAATAPVEAAATPPSASPPAPATPAGSPPATPPPPSASPAAAPSPAEPRSGTPSPAAEPPASPAPPGAPPAAPASAPVGAPPSGG